METNHSEITTIAFDADDTLWVNETIFTTAQKRCKTIAGKFIEPERLDAELYEIELRNLEHFGYGIKGFMLSMIETLIQISEGKILGSDIHKIIELGKEMINHPVHLIDGVEEVLQKLHGDYKLMIITKGDLFDQESKIARSGLADYFQIIEVVSDKTPTHYNNVFSKHNISLDEVLMVGNSLKSDVLPICELGGRAVHIPFHTTWVHEIVQPSQLVEKKYYKLSDISLIPEFISDIANEK